MQGVIAASIGSICSGITLKDINNFWFTFLIPLRHPHRRLISISNSHNPNSSIAMVGFGSNADQLGAGKFITAGAVVISIGTRLY